MKFFRPLYIVVLISFFAVSCGSGGGGGTTALPPETDEFAADLPFDYSYGASTLEVDTPGGETIHVSVGSYGAHFTPMSGDLLGDFKSNLIGLFAIDTADLEELSGTGGNDDGICDTGERCAFWGGLSGEHIRSRIPEYTAPDNGTLTRVSLLELPGVGYFGSPPHWEIQIQFNSQFSMRIGHLASLSSNLRNKILGATGLDTDTYAGPPGAIVSNGTIDVSQDEALGEPHIFANEVATHPGYYIGGGTVSGVPWAQMEFTFGDNQARSDVCVYDLLTNSEKDAIQGIMEADILDATSMRYAFYAASRWIWSAEGILCPVYSAEWQDFSSIHARTGGWTERPEAGTIVDELFAMVTIQKDSAAYDAALYSSSGVDYLASRQVGPGLPAFNWIMPDSTTVRPFLAVGEVLEITEDSFLAMWRDIGWTNPVYQRAVFALDNDGLKIKWGGFSSSELGALQPTFSQPEPCNDTSVLCYDHQARL